MLFDGDKIRVTRADGAEKAGWAVLKIYTRPVWDFHTNKASIRTVYEIVAPCGESYSPTGLAGMLEDSEPWTTEPWCYDIGNTPNYLCMAEQLIASGEMPGME